jgi:hypothetical protein
MENKILLLKCIHNLILGRTVCRQKFYNVPYQELNMFLDIYSDYISIYLNHNNFLFLKIFNFNKSKTKMKKIKYKPFITVNNYFFVCVIEFFLV